MPFIFIHGVNTRDTDEGFQDNIDSRNALLRRAVLNRLAEHGERFRNIQILNPYWGDKGATFKWQFATLPEVKTFEHLGADDASVAADVEIAETVRDLARREGKAPPRLEQLGQDDGVLKAAASRDLTRFMETVLTPILLSEMRLADGGSVPLKSEGVLQALLAEAVYDVSKDPDTQQAVATAVTDDEVMERLKLRTQQRFEELARAESARPAAPAEEKPLETLGPGWWEDLKDRIGEVFDRARDAPGRAATIPVLDWKRDSLHKNLARFLGDVLVYLKERGPEGAPGPIIKGLVDTIRTAPKNHPDEPVIVMTHSMGGNILYDILTFYAPDLRVDAWVSVASQVGQFEEMNIFQASKETDKAPGQVGGLRERVGYWLNVYDPADVLSFKAAPVFADVNDDVAFLGGSSSFKAHGEYFGRRSFYELVREKLEHVLG